MAPQGKRSSRPWRPLAMLVMIIVIMLVSITGADTFRPGLWHQQFKVGLGLDLAGGTEAVLQAQPQQGHPPSTAEMNQAGSIILSRVNGTGTTGSQVRQQGSSLITVSIPGKDSTQVINEVSNPAQMRFRQVLLWEPPLARAARRPPATYFGAARQVNAATMKLFSKLRCTPGSDGNVDDAWKSTVGYTPQQAQWDDVGRQIVSCDASGGKYVLDKAVFKGTDVIAENASLLPNSTQWAVNLALDHAATTAFGALTTRQYDNYYPSVGSSQDAAVLDQTAMVLDGDVVSAPQTTDALTSGQFQVSGPSSAPFTQAQATHLADLLKYGALPVSFTVASVSAVSAQLGHDSLVAGLTAGIIGLILVIIYLFLYYRGLGLVSVSSLLIASLLAYLAVVLLSKYQDFTMELSGIAGLIVAIGITADSFIVFFERLRDEVRDGKSLRPAVESGWKRARRTILVSDTVSFLAAVLLYHFAVERRAGLRLHPRPDHAHRRARGVPVHQADGDPAGRDEVLRRRAPVVRARSAAAGRPRAVAILCQVTTHLG